MHTPECGNDFSFLRKLSSFLREEDSWECIHSPDELTLFMDISPLGRFGNKYIMLKKLLIIALHFQIKKIFIQMSQKFLFEFDNTYITIVNSSDEIPDKRNTLCLNAHDLFHTNDDDINNFYGENDINRTTAREIIRTCIPCSTQRAVGEETLFIHLRGGDVFRGPDNKDAPIHRGYRQPPFAWYRECIASHARRHDGCSVILVSEDRKNPCLTAIRQWCQAKKIPCEFAINTLEKDYALLMSAQSLVCSAGTFLVPCLDLNQKLRHIYVFDFTWCKKDAYINERNWKSTDYQIKRMLQLTVDELDLPADLHALAEESARRQHQKQHLGKLLWEGCLAFIGNDELVRKKSVLKADWPKLYLAERQKNFLEQSRCALQELHDADSEAFIGRLLRAIRPYDAAGTSKVRLGPYTDGGYVMLDPGRGGLAYSLGISTYAPWDSAMARRGFEVHQYDASITRSPAPHPNIYFHPYYIMEGGDLPENARRLPCELLENGHGAAENIILQIDVEGAEWEIFTAMDTEALKQFRQIIVEFHNLRFDEEKLAVLEKLRVTHTPVHVHYNNYGKLFYSVRGFFYQPLLLEISYARSDDFVFTPCNGYFPTFLDAPNVGDKPDLPIGFFDILLRDFAARPESAPRTPPSRIPSSRATPPPPRAIPAALRNAFSMNGRIRIAYEYYDDRTHGHTPHISRKDYTAIFEALEKRTFTYYNGAENTFYDALADYDISGKQGLIWGLANCNCEAIALWKNASEVYVVDYNKPVCDHASVHTLNHDELRALDRQFDFAVSVSSFEHDGLGRYGDPLDPDGDLRAMREAAKYLKDDGILFLGVPLGPDSLCWNAHRIYGPIRLPLLLRGWIPQSVYSTSASVFDGAFFDHRRQPLLVLQKSATGCPLAEQLSQRLLLAGTRRATGDSQPAGTRNETLLRQILAFMLADGSASCEGSAD